MDVNEAEIQILASLSILEAESSPTDRRSLEARGERYWIFKENWDGAFEELIAKNLVEGDQSGYRLTGVGRPLGELYRGERPDMYWYYYQKFYSAARASAAHSKLCDRVFGENLCQEGQADMESLEHLLSFLDLKGGESVLDLGCGAGVISEYVSDKTGATVTGLDYAASAIAEATERTKEKQHRLSFVQANFNELKLTSKSLDAVISLDTLYWVADLEKTLSILSNALKQGGRMGIFMNHHIGANDPSGHLEARHSKLSQALSALGLSCETIDFTKAIGEFWHRIFEAASDLRKEFEAEGNGFIAASLIRESEEDYLPDINEGRIARYLYLVRC